MKENQKKVFGFVVWRKKVNVSQLDNNLGDMGGKRTFSET